MTRHPSTRDRNPTAAADRSRRKAATAIVSALVTAVCALGHAAALPPAAATSPVATAPNPKVEALIAQMTVPEKFGMLGGTGFPAPGGSAGAIPGVPRLGIPAVRMADGPAGVRASVPATAMPAPIALGATFSPRLAHRYGSVLGQEAKALGMDVLLAPMMNSVRTPFAGRNFETLSEDPLLTSALVSDQVGSIQDHDVIATTKHYAENNQELGRRGIDVNVDEQTLREVELPGFEAAVDAGVGAVMCAYNKVNGAQSCEHPELLTSVLRDDWGFDGFVMTDWFAPHGAGALEAGLDVEMPTAAAFRQLNRDTKGDGVVDEADLAPGVRVALDRAVRGVLTSMDKAGLLDGPVQRPDRAVTANAAVAEEVALSGAVLLRNEHNALPLAPADVRDLAVIGPTANRTLIGGGGSARVVPAPGSVGSALSALRRLAGKGTNISYAVGEELDGTLVPASALSPAEQVNRTGDDTVTSGDFAWSGTLTAPADGVYTINLQTTGNGGTLTFDGAQIASTTSRFGAAGGDLVPTEDGFTNDGFTVALKAGEPHRIAVRGNGTEAAPLQIRLAWVTPQLRAKRIQEAVALARSARTAVVFAYNEGTEGADRASLHLPGFQEEVIDAVSRANPGTVVVLNTGDPVLMPWLDRTSSVLQMWYPGQEGGPATAELLLGRATPAGKLPVTFPASPTRTPVSDPENYPGIDTVGDGTPDTQRYTEGINVGYRWYAATDTQPLFPFGHGLSYTKFGYSDLRTTRTADGLDVSFVLRNTGSRIGTEVPQVYLSAGTTQHTPALKLAGFDRVTLRPGTTRRVTVHVSNRELSSWSAEADQWALATGSRSLRRLVLH